MDYDYDVVVIGAGIAGFVSAVTANGLGKRVALIEKRKIGGNCTNFTCIPSKALIRKAHMNREMVRLEGARATAGCGVADTIEVMDYVRSIVRRAVQKDLPETFEHIGIEVLKGKASFVDRHRLRLNGDTISSNIFIIASGTLPLIPPISGLTDVDYLTNETVFELDALPGSLIVLGGGVAGMEFASAFGRLGVQTSVIEAGPRFLASADREPVNRLVRELRRDGINLLSGTRAERLWKDKDKATVLIHSEGRGHQEIQADRVLVSIGRRPDIEGLNLEKAGVSYKNRGILTDSRLKTSVNNIYACGDIVGPYQLASMAEYQAIVATTNALLPAKTSVDYSNNVYVIYTEPPLAFLGFTEEQAHQRYGHRLKVYRFDYENMRRALTDGMQAGMAKLLCDPDGLVVGAHILGESASEVIHEIQLVKALRIPLHRLQTLTHAYPTYAQAIVGRAGQLAFLDRMGSSYFVGAALRLLPQTANRLSLARDRLAEDNSAAERSHTRSAEQQERQRMIGILSPRPVGDACVVHLPPDLMHYDETPILAACSSSGLTDLSAIVLDCSDLERINGLGAVALVKAQARIRRQRGRMAACGLPQGLKEVFRVTALDTAIDVYDDEAAAVAGRKPRKAAGQYPVAQGFLKNLQDWARPIERLGPLMPSPEARNLNTVGRSIESPVNGFGQLWQKVFRLSVSDPEVSPEDAIGILKPNFGHFQPRFNRFFPSPRGLAPGEVVPFDSFTPGGPISTAVLVLYSDQTSFTFITPQGHPEAGMVSFGARRIRDKTVVEIVGVARAGDPIYEGAFKLIGSRIQNRIWRYVLSSLAIHLGVPADITLESRCIDRGRNWSRAGNLWHNAQIRTLLAEPTRWPDAVFRRLKWQTGGPAITRTTPS